MGSDQIEELSMNIQTQYIQGDLKFLSQIKGPISTLFLRAMLGPSVFHFN
jgi:hypothetical protein